MNWILMTALCLGMARAGEVELLTRPVAGGARASANGDSTGAVFSPDGQFILFSSSANDLAVGRFNQNLQLYLKNLATGSVELVSAGANGEAANGVSLAGGISADNRYVVFQSEATNLAEGDTNSVMDIYLRDLVQGTNLLITAGSGRGASRYPEITPDGEWVVFRSRAGFGLPDNSDWDIYAWRRTDGTFQLVSADLNGVSQRVDVGDFSLSDNGKVAFTAAGTNLVTGGSGTNTFAYVRDLATGVLTSPSAGLKVTSAGSGSYTNAASLHAQISRDGVNTYFIATGTNVQQTPRPMLFRYSSEEQGFTFYSLATNGVTGLEQTHGYSISSDGEKVAFVYQSNVYHGGTNLFDAQPIDGQATASTFYGVSDTPTISGSGRYVAFLSAKTNLVEGVEVSGMQLYLHDLSTGTNRLVSQRVDGSAANEPPLAGFIFSPDDSKLVFESYNDGLVENDTNGRLDIFAYDVASGEILLISVSGQTNAMFVQSGPSSPRGIAADGHAIAINSVAQLKADDTNRLSDLYMLDRQMDFIRLLQHETNGIPGGAFLSSDAATLVYESNGRIQKLNLESDSVTAVVPESLAGSATLFGISTNADSIFYSIGGRAYRNDLPFGQQNLVLREASADGALAIYTSSSAANSTRYLYDFSAGTSNTVPSYSTISADGSALASRTSTSINVLNRASNEVVSITAVGATNHVINANGKFVVYEIGEPRNIGLFDVETRSRSKIITDGNGSSVSPVVSADGRFVVFESWASNLATADGNNTKDVFLYDRLMDRTTLVSVRADGSGSGNGPSFNPVFSGDSSTLLFQSAASDLVADDVNDAVDIFAVALDSSWSIAQGIEATEGGLWRLAWNGPAIGRFAVEFKDDIAQENWTERIGAITGEKGEYSIILDTSEPQRFYRIRYIP